MTIYEFIDTMIVRLNGVEVKGAANMNAILQTIADLGKLKDFIHVEAKEAPDAENHNEERDA